MKVIELIERLKHYEDYDIHFDFYEPSTCLGEVCSNRPPIVNTMKSICIDEICDKTKIVTLGHND